MCVCVCVCWCASAGAYRYLFFVPCRRATFISLALLTLIHSVALITGHKQHTAPEIKKRIKQQQQQPNIHFMCDILRFHNNWNNCLCLLSFHYRLHFGYVFMYLPTVYSILSGTASECESRGIDGKDKFLAISEFQRSANNWIIGN